MKFSLSVICIAFLVAVAQCDVKQDIKIKFVECSKENNAPENLAQQLRNQEIITDRASLCTMACFNLKIGLVYPNNTLNGEKFKKVLTFLHKLSEDKAAEVTDICNKIVSAIVDKCTAAGALQKCIKNNVN